MANPLLKITDAESIVIRAPRGGDLPEHYVAVPTGDAGLWNRLDHASPSRIRRASQATLVKIAIMAEVHGVHWSPHVSSATALPLAASTDPAAHTTDAVLIEGGSMLEHPVGNALLREPWPWEHGEVRVPEGPGIGVDVDEDQLSTVQVI